MRELRRKRFKIYPLRFRPEGALSRYTLVGNLEGNSEKRLRKLLNVPIKPVRFDFSRAPGHFHFLNQSLNCLFFDRRDP